MHALVVGGIGQMTALLYARCARVLREVLDPERARTAQAKGAAQSVKEALDVELIRIAAKQSPL
jgi:hypothetical protein